MVCAYSVCNSYTELNFIYLHEIDINHWWEISIESHIDFDKSFSGWCTSIIVVWQLFDFLYKIIDQNLILLSKNVNLGKKEGFNFYLTAFDIQDA